MVERRNTVFCLKKLFNQNIIEWPETGLTSGKKGGEQLQYKYFIAKNKV